MIRQPINRRGHSLPSRMYGCKGSYAFMKLPGHDRTKQVHPGAMHTITNVITTLMSLLSGNFNTTQVLCVEKAFGRSNWYHEAGTNEQGKN